jgi:hypothetical protein
LYYQCESCRTLFSDPLPQDGLVGGQHEAGRALQNDIRLDRIKTMTQGMKKEDIRILDYGCGNFILGKYLQNEGYNVTGYDAYNEEYSRLPEKNKYHLCLMIEVIEHTSHNFIELDVIHRSLVDGALLYVESGFINICDEDKIELENYVYISDIAGHSTVFSHHGLDLLLFKKSFITRRHFDRNCRLFEKVKKQL